mmetsp:Transcript_25573/g.60459  ORF Transcript_25573/g.60459 Transcript_25573/m.60459 type:complete len:666 (-) Transcript_25573:99-2096(-)
MTTKMAISQRGRRRKIATNTLVLGCVVVLALFSQSSSVSGFVVPKEQHQHQRPTSASTTTSIYFVDPTNFRSSFAQASSSSSSLSLFRRLRRKWKERRERKKQQQKQEEENIEGGDAVDVHDTVAEEVPATGAYNNDNEEDGRLVVTNTQPFEYEDIVKSDDGSGNIFGNRNQGPIEDADLVIVGGGISGLAAAITTVEKLQSSSSSTAKPRVILLEASPTFGGRVASIQTDDGYVLDEGFAVFIEEYPEVKRLLDYDALDLKPFLPGALVKLRGRTALGRVADPLRQPADLVPSVLSPVGSLFDKIKVLPLVFNVLSKSVEELFEEKEVPTSDALENRWGFSESFISSFLQPFLEGIYLAPLNEQSSRMFSFVFKMFSEGSATLPKGGMQTVTDQLVERAKSLGIELISDCPVSQLSMNDGDESSYVVNCGRQGKHRRFKSPSVIVATDGAIAQRLLSNVPGFESLETLPKQPQLAVGCLYYALKGAAPVEEPILVLNGIGPESGTEDFPVNNICFPSVVNTGYAPEGYNLCSVTVLSKAMDIYKDRPEELDAAVRHQLGSWFPNIKKDIREEWELKKIFYIPKAQPSQLTGPSPANQNGGRPSNIFRGKELPKGVLVCGDHQATATLNGAVESGVNAGTDASKLVSSALKSNTDTATKEPVAA